MIFVCSFTLLFIFSIDVYTCTDFLTRKAMGLLQFHDKPYMFQRSAYWKMPWFMDHPSATAPWNQDTRREAPHLTCDCIHISSHLPQKPTAALQTVPSSLKPDPQIGTGDHPQLQLWGSYWFSPLHSAHDQGSGSCIFTTWWSFLFIILF